MEKQPPKKQCRIELFIGGGASKMFVACELEDNLFPDLTFTGQQVMGSFLDPRKRFVTTAPYLITHALEGK